MHLISEETQWHEVFQLIQETQSSKVHRISQVAPMQRVSRQKKGNRKLEAHLMNRVVPNEMSEPSIKRRPGFASAPCQLKKSIQ